MRIKINLIFLVSISLVFIALFLLKETPLEAPKTSNFKGNVSETVIEENKLSEVIKENLDSISTTEQQKTQRMIRAHAPLRKQEIADPNSVENQEQFQKMIFKSLEK